MGWTIPHIYSPSDPDADQELNTAEAYAKHAIEILAKMPKPAGLTDEQFATAKTRRTFQAHSALGLVYFRREDYEHSASELEQSTKEQSDPGSDRSFRSGSRPAKLESPWRSGGGFSRMHARSRESCRINASRTRNRRKRRWIKRWPSKLRRLFHYLGSPADLPSLADTSRTDGRECVDGFAGDDEASSSWRE